MFINTGGKMSWCFPDIDMFTVSTVIWINNLRFQSLGNDIFGFEEVFCFESFKCCFYFDFARFQGIVQLICLISLLRVLLWWHWFCLKILTYFQTLQKQVKYTSLEKWRSIVFCLTSQKAQHMGVVSSYNVRYFNIKIYIKSPSFY